GLGALLVVHRDAGLAVLDDEEADPAAPLDGEALPRSEVPLLHRARDLLDLLPAEVGEERYALDEVDGGSGHGAFMPDAGLGWKRVRNARVGEDVAVRLTIVGCSPAWPNPGGAQSGYLVEGRGRLLLDCGPGVLARLREREAWPQMDAIAITHFHLDHWGDIGPCEHLVDLARDADLFLCEATLERGVLDGEPRGHLSVEEAIEAFEASGAKRLLVTHRPDELPLDDGLERAYDGLELEV